MIKRVLKTKVSPASLNVKDQAREMVQRLHSTHLKLVITDIVNNTPTTRTFRMFPAEENQPLPYFRCGQYLSVYAKIGQSITTRGYSLSSSPSDSLPKGDKPGFYEITIRKSEEGFLTPYIWDNWKPGTIIEASGPHGTFYYDSARDTNEIIGIAGGSGITPFRSLMKEIIQSNLDIKLTLLYGSRDCKDIVFEQEITEMVKQSKDRISMACIISEPDQTWNGETGFIDANKIEKHMENKANKTFFICGPPAMYEYVMPELNKIGIPDRRIRKEVYGSTTNITSLPGFPSKAKGKTFNIKVNQGINQLEIPGKSNESVLVAIERAGLIMASRCRSGLCGICRGYLKQGEVFIDENNDGRRKADKQFGVIHTCAAYPISDIEITIPVAEAPIP